jgi:HAD superfamily 5'-nucleotidase-like hydrolase
MTDWIEEHIPYPRRIFCNRNLRMDSIKFIGFDMDYTLALYTEAMEHLQADLVLKRLVEQFGFPVECLSIKYDPTFAIRGLSVDMKHGNIFKMDSHRFVGPVWHGDAPLDKAVRRDLYTNRKIILTDPDIVMVDTQFSLPEISLYCQLVTLYDARSPENSPPDYKQIWTQLRAAMDTLHQDETLKDEVRKDIPKFVIKDPELSDTLHRFRSAGKKLFLLTNSEANYTEPVMSYLLDGEHPGYNRWFDYFDVIITSARKPSFFTGETPFVRVDAQGNTDPSPVTSFQRGAMYQGGNLTQLKDITGMVGDEVLYVGDHIYGDILRSKRDTLWRTAMIIQEMERELDQSKVLGAALDRLEHLEQDRVQINLERAAKAMSAEGRDKDLTARAKELNREIAGLDSKIAERFNSNWGMLFRDRAELSAMGAQVENYACLYTAKASNFRLYSPLWYFRSPRNRMPHEELR